jgi:ethanolamine utilization microcompartment shell protein EutL
MTTELRVYAPIDRMQPQTAAHLAATSHGDVPLSGMTELFIEVSPGNEIFRIADVAFKAADVRPSLQIVEREFGLLEFHATDPADVHAAGEAVLADLGLNRDDCVKPVITSTQFVTNIHPYQAQLLNKWRKGSMLLGGSSLFILEVAPAAWISLAANEAEKAATVQLIETRAVGRFGRLFLAGTEAEVRNARDAAADALEAVPGRTS